MLMLYAISNSHCYDYLDVQMPSSKYSNFDASDDEFIVSDSGGGGRFDVVFRGGSTLWRERSLLEKLLIGGSLILLIVVIVLAALLATSHQTVKTLRAAGSTLKLISMKLKATCFCFTDQLCFQSRTPACLASA